MQRPDILEEWECFGPRYRAMVASGPSSSSWLRGAVLKPEVIRLLGDCSTLRVLDAGTGSGWLFDAAKIAEPHACDITKPESLRSDIAFVQADIAALPYPDHHFDAVLASLVLCYCSYPDKVATELLRVTAVGGKLVVALVHPQFYRTGVALENDQFLIESDLSKPDKFPILIGGSAGPFSYYRHPIPAYVNALIGAGWHLEQMSELFIPRAEYEARFRQSDLIRRSTRVPLFVAFRFWHR